MFKPKRLLYVNGGEVSKELETREKVKKVEAKVKEEKGSGLLLDDELEDADEMKVKDFDV